MPLPSYGWRIGFLISACSAIALNDLIRKGSASTKWREYVFLLLGGLLGALFGGTCDVLITSKISPEYFTIGKGLTGGEGFTRRVLTLGLQAGFGPGAITASVFLYSNWRPSWGPPLTWTSLTRLLGIPIVSAAGCAVILPYWLAHTDPMAFTKPLKALLTSDQAERFVLVWWVHCSIYLGSLLGLLGATFYIYRSREQRRHLQA